MNNTLAKALSYLFHPIFIPSYLFLVIYFFSPLPLFLNLFTSKSWWALMLILFIYTAIFPLMAIFWLRRRKIIQAIDLPNREDRPQVYFIVSAFYIALFYFFHSKGTLLVPASYLIIIFFVNIIGLALITLKFKISAHASAITCVITIFGSFVYKYGETNLILPLFTTIILAGLICTARLQLNAHSLKQVVSGSLWGLFTGLTGIFVLF